MIAWLKDRSGRRRTGHELYERIVAASRRQALYASYDVPDTVDGRLELLLLHVIVVLDGLKREGPAGQRLGQRVMECLVADIDDAMRRSGLGDDSVAGRMPRLAGALMERARDYGLAFDAAPAVVAAVQPEMSPGSDDRRPHSLEAALVAHVYRPKDAAEAASCLSKSQRLARYVEDCRALLGQGRSADLLEGKLELPEPL